MLNCMPATLNNFKHILQLSSKVGCSRDGLIKNACILPLVVIPSRTTIIFKRRFPVGLYKEGNNPRMRRRTHYYEVEEVTHIKKEPLTDVVLTSYVSGVGNPGDIVSLKRSIAYHSLLLPGLGDYPTPENLEYSRNLKKDVAVQEKQITPSVESCMKYLEERAMSIVMNKETEWTIEPWHIRVSFRKAGIHILSDSSIELPPQPIRGPDMNLEGKEFYVTLTINGVHKVKVRCRIHHWSTDIADRLPYQQDFWLSPGEKLFPEEAADSTSSSSI